MKILRTRINRLGHDEVCNKRMVLRIIRHESVKKTLTYHLRTVPNTEVEVEAPIRPTGRPARDQLRADLRVTGTASYRQATTDYDVSIISTFAASYTQPRGAHPPTKLFRSICFDAKMSRPANTPTLPRTAFTLSS